VRDIQKIDGVLQITYPARWPGMPYRMKKKWTKVGNTMQMWGLIRALCMLIGSVRCFSVNL
jgi:hypothetical protein